MRGLEATLREVYERGFIHGDNMPKRGPVLEELLRRGYVKQRDMVLSAALVALAGASQPDRAAEAASSLLRADEPSPYGHSPLYDLTEPGFLFLEARPPKPPHCGQIRNWTLQCHGPGRCACTCQGCTTGQRLRKVKS